MAPSPESLRLAAECAELSGEPFEVVVDGVTVRLHPEAAEGFHGLFTIRAKSGARMLVRRHYSVEDVAQFDFERCWRNSLDLRIVR